MSGSKLRGRARRICGAKRLVALALCVALLAGCSAEPSSERKQFTATFLSLFDTLTTIVGFAESEAAFEEIVAPIRDELERYHRLFDIYNEYDGLNNLKTLNDRAALEPIEVDGEIIELLSDAVELSTATGGVFNPAMGSVLRLWHDAREASLDDPANAFIPDAAALSDAAEHIDPSDIVIDRERSTVFFSDPELKLDVGAIAKGWAVERVCETAPEGLLISVGGNVRATGPKNSDGAAWAVGIQNPDGSSDYLKILNITSGSVVTSGSYQRAFAVDGEVYHHLIDPKTLAPGELWVSVSVVCADSGVADALSTALFLLDREAGLELLERFDAHAMWVDAENNEFFSPNFADFIRN